MAKHGLSPRAAVPPVQRTPVMQRALAQGAQFLLRSDLARADYPANEQISAAWFKLGFPLSYWSDVLETLTMLVALGYGRDPRLAEAYQWLVGKQDAQGRWTLEHALTGKMWVDIERRGKPSKWITVRALRLIKAMEAAVISVDTRAPSAASASRPGSPAGGGRQADRREQESGALLGRNVSRAFGQESRRNVVGD